MIQEAELSPARQQFIQTWGDMSSSWGISRTMSQIYALLFSSPLPLDTDSIMEKLAISRGNANMNIRELIHWGLVRKEIKPPARKEFFSAEKDVGLLTSLILVERQKRELKPVTDAIEEIIQSIKQEAAENPSAEDEEFVAQLQQLRDFLILFNEFTARALPYLKEKNIRRLDKLLQAFNVL